MYVYLNMYVYMYVCVCAFIFICMCIATGCMYVLYMNVYVYIYVWMSTCVCASEWVCMCGWVCVSLWVYVLVCACACLWVYVCLRVCVRVPEPEPDRECRNIHSNSNSLCIGSTSWPVGIVEIDYVNLKKNAIWFLFVRNVTTSHIKKCENGCVIRWVTLPPLDGGLLIGQEISNVIFHEEI